MTLTVIAKPSAGINVETTLKPLVSQVGKLLIKFAMDSAPKYIPMDIGIQKITIFHRLVYTKPAR